MSLKNQGEGFPATVVISAEHSDVILTKTTFHIVYFSNFITELLLFWITFR